MYYLVINDVHKEFAIVEKNYAELINDVRDEHDSSNIYLLKLSDSTNWDKLIEEYGAKGYRYTVIDTYQDVLDFVTE